MARQVAPKGRTYKGVHGDRIRYDTGMDRMTKLNSIIRNGIWCPPPAISMDLIEAWSALQAIERLNFNDDDKVIWTATPNGAFFTSSAWNLIRGNGTQVEWHSVVWCTNYIPKHSFLAWRVMMKRLRM